MTGGQWLGKPQDKRYNSARWKKMRKQILGFLNVCALCGHPLPPGRGELDHVNPVELLTTDEEFYARANIQVMHGVRTPCLICSAASGYAIKGCCNQFRAAAPLKVARARLARRTGLDYGQTVPGRSRAVTAPSRANPAEDDYDGDGREW